MNRFYNYVLRITPGLAILVGWQVLISLKPSYEFYMGSPTGIARELLTSIRAGAFQRDVSITALETVSGFLIGSTMGTFCGLMLWYSNSAYNIARPYIVSLGSIPVFALGPILIFWFGTGLLSKIFLGLLSTFTIALVQAHTGASEADPNLQNLLRVFGATRTQIFFKVIAPAATIWVLAGVRINIGMALLGAFIGEFISSSGGLGYRIILAEGLYNVNGIWVGILGIVTIAIILSSLTSPIEEGAKRWQMRSS